ncbi:MAG: M23 family metallopeptidase [Gammaproteobacteria bacterium]|nr:M23 family metallopeptidase [Gammaproteobacteria bacterium]
MAIHIVLLCIFGYLSIVIASGYKWRGESISLTAPVESNGWVVHGGGTVAVNYHNGVKAQRYALDIIVLDENGRRGRTWLPAELNDFSSFGKSVLSPCDGKVLATENNQEDRAIGELRDDSPAGNFVLLHCHGNTVLLAHLKKGSVLVKTGDSVEPGRPLAKIGNSGRSSEPHLHIHAVKGKVMDMKMVIATGEPVALLINGEFSRRGDILHLNEKTSE